MTDIAFTICAVFCVLSSILIVTQKNPVYSVVYMLPFFLAMTVIFVLLQATFLAAIQMIVYGGAILVVFLFVIMLINLKPDELKNDFSLWPWVLSWFAVGALGGIFVMFASHGVTAAMEQNFAAPTDTRSGIFGSIGSVAMPLFKEHMVPFELASILIVVAILGSVLLSKKRV